ncbi:MAG: IclR family transcriptional regulator [Solirubrobacteraceae bacterium]
MPGRIQSVERSIDILMALADGPRTLTEITRATSLSKGTVFRMLTSLNHERLVIKDPVQNRYMLGPGFLRLVQGMVTGLGSISAGARPVLETLRDKANETVTLHVGIGTERVCIEEFQSRASIRYTSYPGATAALHLGSAGKVLIGFLDDAKQEAALRAVESYPAEDRPDVDALRKELEKVRRQGWAMSSGERIAGAAAISVPVWGHHFLAALSILGPESRLSRKRRLELLPDLKHAAAAVEAALEVSSAAELESAGRAARRVRAVS